MALELIVILDSAALRVLARQGAREATSQATDDAALLLRLSLLWHRDLLSLLLLLLEIVADRVEPCSPVCHGTVGILASLVLGRRSLRWSGRLEHAHVE